MADELLLNIRGLKVEARGEAGWTEIVHGVDLDLKRGEILGLIGESGSGKSTIGLAAMGFARDGCRISGGAVTFDGVELTTASDAERRALRGSRIAYVAQSAAASFNPSLKLIDQCTEVATVHGKMDRRLAQSASIDLFKRLHLPKPAEIGFRYPHQLSGGQLQRAMTAMAMVCRPELIVFDEPTTALDVTTQIEVLAAIREVVRQFGTSAIYITHDLAVVAQMADRVKVLLKGEEVEEAPTRTMLATPKEDYTRSLWAVRSLRAEAKPATVPRAVPILAVDRVSASYGAISVLDDVSFALHPGRTLAVVGESGSGKSTTARVITGLLPPTRGEVRLDGEVLPASYRQRSKEQLRRIQFIYQMADTALNPTQTIRDILGRPIEFYLGVRGKEKEERIRALLRSIELEPDKYIDRLPRELSGGQKQRIGIARALAAEPQVVICDEVTSALDQLVTEGILKLLLDLQKRLGLSYVFITHDLATVEAIADEVVVMQRGRVVEAAAKADLFRPPHHPYTELLLSSVPQMDPDWLDRLLAERAANEGAPT